MDFKELVAPEAVTASTTASGLPAIRADASTYAKTGASFALGLAGMFYLGWGKRSGDVRKMLIGAAMTVASILLF